MTNATAATFRRLRAAIREASDSAEVAVLVASTELSLPAALAYARDYMLLEGRRVRLVLGSGKLEIGPERRSRTTDRRSGRDRRTDANVEHLWVDRRTTNERRTGTERRHGARAGV